MKTRPRVTVGVVKSPPACAGKARDQRCAPAAVYAVTAPTPPTNTRPPLTDGDWNTPPAGVRDQSSAPVAAANATSRPGCVCGTEPKSPEVAA